MTKADVKNIKSKKELLEKIGGYGYGKILNSGTLSYLEDLIRLRESATDEADFDWYNHISDLKIYDDIVNYNLYNRILNLMNESDDKYEIESYNSGLLIKIKLENRDICLIDFNYSKDRTTNLYKSVIDENNNDELSRIIVEKIYKLEDTPKQYLSLNLSSQLENYRKRLNELEKKEYTDDDYREVELTEKYQKMMLEEYDVKESDFEEYFLSSTNKKLVKKVPNLTIYNNIRYL